MDRGSFQGLVKFAVIAETLHSDKELWYKHSLKGLKPALCPHPVVDCEELHYAILINRHFLKSSVYFKTTSFLLLCHHLIIEAATNETVKFPRKKILMI